MCLNFIRLCTFQVYIVQAHVISAINSRINDAATKPIGSPLLDLIIPTLHHDTISKHEMFMDKKKIIQLLENSHSSVKDVTIACKAGGIFIFEGNKIHDYTNKYLCDPSNSWSRRWAVYKNPKAVTRFILSLPDWYIIIRKRETSFRLESGFYQVFSRMMKSIW